MRGARVHLLALFLCGLVVATASTAAGQSVRFRRADANADGRLDPSDVVFTLVYLFLKGPAPLCFDAADANDDGGIDISDPVKTLVHLFRGGEPPPPPGLRCGLDPTADTLSCVEYPDCEGGFTGSVIISEFMATNARTLRDGDGEYSDWIELANVGTSEVNLEGYYLTDDADEKTKWAFHSGGDVTLAPGEFLVVIASGKPVADYVDRNGRLHTTFKLNRNGEYVALVLPDGETVISSHGFPRQFVDVSSGVLEDALAPAQLSASA